MVEVEAVGRALDPADAGERAVERVAEPLRDQQRARHPEPVGGVVGELVGGADAERREHAERRQVVGQDPARQPRRDPGQQPLLGLGEQEARLARRLDRAFSPALHHRHLTRRRRGGFRHTLGQRCDRRACSSSPWRSPRVLAPRGERRRRQAGRDDRAHQVRRPAHPRADLEGARLRLRLRLRRGQHLHDRRLLRDGERRALAVLRPGRELDVLGQRLGQQQPLLRLLLRADQRVGDRRGPDLAPAAGGPGAGAARSSSRGYVAGYNAYLRDTGVDKIPDKRCRGADWVRPITELDVYRRFHQLGSLASAGAAIEGIGEAAPALAAPRAEAAERGAGAGASTELETGRGRGLLPARQRLQRLRARQRGDRGTGRGMVLGNPHFPWDGAERLYQAHLTIPGKLDVAGASLYGVPLILIGHTRGLAWSHTVASAWRFTPFELTLVPGDPHSYLVDGQPRAMKAGRAHGQGADARRRARGPHPDAVRDRVRADADLDPRPAAVPVDAGDGLRARRRQLRELPLPQPLPRHQPRAVGAPRTTASSARSRASRGSTASPPTGAGGPTTRWTARSRTCPTPRRRRLRGLARRRGLPAHGHPDPRRLALGVRLGHRPRRGRRRGSSARLRSRACFAATTSPTATTATGSRNPEEPLDRLRPGDRRRGARRARCAPGSGW